MRPRRSISSDIFIQANPSVGTSTDAARKSACATLLVMTNQAQLSGGIYDLPGYWGGRCGAIPAVFHYHGERDAFRTVAIIGREAGEPGVRHAFVELRGAGLARDTHRFAFHRAAPGSFQHY